MEETDAPKETIQPDEESATSHIFIIKVTTNKEDRALELISDKVHKKDLNILSLARPHGLRGYIFLEAADRDSAEDAAYNLPYVKGIIGKTVSYEEIKNMLEPVLEEINIEKGDVVEIIGEPFKKEKAKVVRVDKGKGEAVVTLLAAVVPIPVTVKLDNVKVIRRDKDEEDGDEDNSENSSNTNKPDNKMADDTPLGDAPDMSLGGDDFNGPSGGLVPDDY
jgi:transcriptional antiterminator NusG